MIAQNPVWPGPGGQGRLVVSDEPRDGARRPFGLDEKEVEGELKAVERRTVIGHHLVQRAVGLAHQQLFLRVGPRQPPHVADDVEDSRLMLGVGAEQAQRMAERTRPRRIGRVVAALGVGCRILHRVHAETIDAAPEPRRHGVQHCGAGIPVAPVDRRLLGQEGVQVVLPGHRVQGPGRAAELADPVGRGATVRRGVAPNIPVALRIVARGSAGHEPGMAVGAVAGHEVQQQFHPACVDGGEQALEIPHRAEDRVDAGIIRHVVAEVGHGRRIEGRDPDRVDAEGC